MARFSVFYLNCPGDPNVYGDWGKAIAAEPKFGLYLKCNSGFGKDAAKWASVVNAAMAAGLYGKVVSLSCEPLDAVFGLCNSVESYWVDALPADAAAEFDPAALASGLRSLSVGDVVRDEGSGKWYVCASFGWEEIALDAVPVNA